MLKQYPIVTLLSAVIAISLFIPWISTPFLGGSPFDLLTAKGFLREVYSQEPTLLLFPLSFLLAAIVAIYTLVKKCCPRPYAIITGALPVGLMLYVAYKASSGNTPMGNMPISVSDLKDIIGIGVYLYVFGSVALLALGFFGKTES